MLILLAGIGLVGWLLFVLMIEPALKQSAAIEADLVSANAQQNQLEVKVASINAKFSKDPNDPVTQKIAQLDDELTKLDVDLSNKTKNLVPPEQMVAMLRGVLDAQDKVELVSLTSIAPSPVFLTEPEEGVKPKADLHRHGVSITVQGGYFDIHAYLAKLEDLRWEFYWKTFDYQIKEYPTGKVQFEIYTLSTSPAFIGM
jgi:MSHA biogenesis protein MshJ